MSERPLAILYQAVGWEPPSPPSIEVCGAARGGECCKFLIVGGSGFECARYTELHSQLEDHKMNAQFIPTQVDCQAERALTDV